MMHLQLVQLQSILLYGSKGGGSIDCPSPLPFSAFSAGPSHVQTLQVHPLACVDFSSLSGSVDLATTAPSLRFLVQITHVHSGHVHSSSGCALLKQGLHSQGAHEQLPSLPDGCVPVDVAVPLPIINPT